MKIQNKLIYAGAIGTGAALLIDYVLAYNGIHAGVAEGGSYIAAIILGAGLGIQWKEKKEMESCKRPAQ